MTKRKYPSELNTRTIRVAVSDWIWLSQLAAHQEVTVAEAFHRLVSKLLHKIETEPEKPVLVSTPMPAFRVSPKSNIELNGNKIIAWRIKSAGVKRGD